MVGAPKGNQNATKGAEWRQAIKRALTRLAEAENPDEEITYRRGLDILAAKFVEAAAEGDAWALKEIGDRLDGKPGQSVTVGGDPDNPLASLAIEFIKPPTTDET